MANTGDTVTISQLHSDLQLATQRMSDMQRLLETVVNEMTAVKNAFAKFTTDQAVASERALRDRAELAELAQRNTELAARVSKLEEAHVALRAKAEAANWALWAGPLIAGAIGIISGLYRK